MNINDIVVTTTNNFEGLKISKYLKPISAHVVAGTNFFSDFFASFSDVFGGRSATYQRQLSSIYQEAIEILKNTALEAGANAIVGMNVDLDEISGKGKSMFMITATGTAVIVENLNNENKNQATEKLSVISFERMMGFRKRMEIIQLAVEKKFKKEDGYVVDDMDKIWDFITANAVFEVANEILDISWYSESYPKLLSYLSSLNVEFTTDLLFNYLMSDKYPNSKRLFDLIRDLKIFDAEKLEIYLQCDNELHRHRAIQLTVNDKPYYLKDDIVVIERLIQIIKTNFKEVVAYSTNKSLLSKEKKIWICPCGKKNDIESEYCSNYECKKDRYGFNESEVNPPKAIKQLEETIEIIKNNLS